MPDTPSLQYALSTDPNPVQVSGSTHDSVATFTYVCSAGRFAVNVQSIAFTFSVGQDAFNLTNQYLEDFGISMPDGWTMTIASSTVTFTPTSGAISIGPEGVTFAFQITINNAIGTSQITVTETLVDADHSTSIDFEVSKFPLDFTVEPLTATPQVLTGPGTSTVLNWSVYGGDATEDGTTYDCVLSYSTVQGGGSETVGQTGPKTFDALAENTLYTLTVSGTDAFGDQFSNVSSVYVVVGPPLATAFSALDGSSDMAVDVGQPASLIWTTQNTTQVLLLPNDGTSLTLTDPLTTTTGYDFYVTQDCAVTLKAQYQDGDVLLSNEYGTPVNITINPPEVLSVTIGSNADANFVDASYHLSFTAKNANYVCLSSTPDQGFDTVWYPVDGGDIPIPTPAKNNVVYTLTPYRMTPDEVALLESGSPTTTSLATSTDDASAAIPMSATLTFTTPGVYFTQHKFPRDTQTYTFNPGRNISGHILTINAFYFEFNNGEDHHISSLGAFIATETTNAASVYANVNQLLSDDSYNTLSSNGYVKVQMIYTDDTSPKVLAFHGRTTTTPTVMNVSEVQNAITGLYKFNWSVSGDDQITGMTLSTGDRTISDGNSVAVSSEKFQVDHNGSSFGSGTLEWDMVAQNGTKPCGLDFKYFGQCNTGTTYSVSGNHPIDSIAVMPTRFSSDTGKNDQNFHSLKLDFSVTGSPGDDTFYFSPTCYWHKSNGDGWNMPVNIMVIVKYAVPEDA
ncbi:hypothetical protein [Gymnodinialimonas sp.]